MHAQEIQKKQTAAAALDLIKPNTIIGVGTGSTVNHFIDQLASLKSHIKGAVSSSQASTIRLQQQGIKVFDLNEVEQLSVYIDGADECNQQLQLIKGGGGALTREKIVASASEQFICIADHSKLVTTMGNFPLPIEVIPMARTQVEQSLLNLGGRPLLRKKFITDNHNIILDIHGLKITDPMKLEILINNIPGVVTNGIFAQNAAHILLLGTENGVKELHQQQESPLFQPIV
jgi:ribose 5-phosphate isomerase A